MLTVHRILPGTLGANPRRLSAPMTVSYRNLALVLMQLLLGGIAPGRSDSPVIANPGVSSSGTAGEAGSQDSVGFPFSEIGARAEKQVSGDAIGMKATPSGASLWSQFQKLSATVDSSGLHLQSTESAGGTLHLVARAVGRMEGAETMLAQDGSVESGSKAVRFTRPGLVEEYSAGMDGIRQDFVVTQSPTGSGDLRVRLALAGATAEAIVGGVRLKFDGSGRELSYHRLHVTDASGKSIDASWEVSETGGIAIRVVDSDAEYPIRIDPTFSNADWAALGSGILNSSVICMTMNGTDLYVGGSFTNPGNRVAKWNGSSWSTLGTGFADGEVKALTMVGTTLYAGGTFTTAGGSPANYIAKWGGSSWTAVGSGVSGTRGSESVEALAVMGSDLYVAGEFTTAGGSTANRIAKWDGSAWSTLGTGFDRPAYGLAVSGSTLYVGGYFSTAGGISAERIAKWDGTSWSAIGSGLTQTVYKVAVSGGNLYAAGNFSTLNRIAKWDGTSWSTLGAGVDSTIRALAVDGTDVYVGGFFSNADGNAASKVARWDGTTWSPIGSGTGGSVYALLVSGSTLYVGGNFTTAGGKSINRVAQVALACDDPTSGGDIDGNQSGDSPFSPATLTSVSGASGHTGTLEYQWQSSTTSSSTGFSDISAANATTYSPGTLTQTTWFKRLARVDCRSGWTEAASSDVVQITVIGPPSQLALTTSAAGAASGAAFTTQPVVAIRDSNGNTVTSDSASMVTMTVSTGATVVGTATATASSGVATFSTVGLSGPAASYTLTFSSGALTTATQPITLATGSASQLGLTTSAAGAASGSAFSTQPAVTIQDSGGNTVTSDSASVVTMTVSTGATIVGTATATASSGVATFSTVGLSGPASAYTLTFSSGSLTTATQPITLGTGSGTQLTLTTQAGGAVSDSAFSTQPVVAVQDSGGNTVTSDSTSVVTMTVSTGATIVGTATATASNGVATFSTVGLVAAAGSYTLTFSSGSLTTATQPIGVSNSTPVPLNPTVSRSSKTLKVPLSSLATDANLDTLTFSALSSTTGATVTISGGYLLYTATVSGASQNDTVSYTVSDATLSANGTLTIQFQGASTQAGQAQNVTVVGGQVTVRFAAIPNLTYQVERADDAGFSVNVTLSSPITFPASGIYTYTDPSPPVSSAYYRLVAN